MSNFLPDAVLAATDPAQQHSRILLLGEQAQAYKAGITERQPNAEIVCMPSTTPPDALIQSGRFGLGIVCDLQAWTEKTAIEQHIAVLRDQSCRQLLIGASPRNDGAFTRADTLALGLSSATGESGKYEARNWYKYSIIAYKRAPDWLNSNDWAHPNRWDQERW